MPVSHAPPLPSSRSSGLTRLFFLGLMIATLLYCAWFVSRWALADLQIKEVRNDLSVWQERGAISELDDWNATKAKLEQALSYRPNDPEYHRLYAFLYEWRLRAPLTNDGSPVTQEEITALYQQTLNETLEGYRKSLSLRPVWPYQWVQLAKAKGFQQQYDEEFNVAMGNIVRYGEHVPEIQFEINQLWLSNADYIGSESSLLNLVTTNAELSLTNNVRKNLELLRSANFLATVCARINTQVIAAVARRSCEEALSAL